MSVMLSGCHTGNLHTACVCLQSIDLLRSSVKTDAARGTAAVSVEPSAASEPAKGPPTALTPASRGADGAESGEAGADPSIRRRTSAVAAWQI
jgi:hypothetical protein